MICAVGAEGVPLSSAGLLCIVEVLREQKIGPSNLICLDDCTGKLIMQQPGNHLRAPSDTLIVPCCCMCMELGIHQLSHYLRTGQKVRY